jgi:hypothetical protein
VGRQTRPDHLVVVLVPGKVRLVDLHVRGWRGAEQVRFLNTVQSPGLKRGEITSTGSITAGRDENLGF